MYAVETKGLVKSFNGFKAVDSLNLKVLEGSIYGFLGPNGAGKTTTIKMLTGLSRPTSGEIRICGKRIRFGSTKNNIDIGFLPDVPNFYDWMTGREFLIFTGELFGIRGGKLKKNVDNLLGTVGLVDVNKRIGSYSRGMKQRLGIAQTLVNEPKVIFLDEPTSALDPVGRKEVMDIIVKLAGKVTVFFSTHILADVERVCDHVVIVDKGKAIIEDSIDNLRLKYSKQVIMLQAIGDDVDGFITGLKASSWLDKYRQLDHGYLEIHTKDIRAAQYKIPKLLSQHGIALEKFIVQEPTLEDIFMKVVNIK